MVAAAANQEGVGHVGDQLIHAGLAVVGGVGEQHDVRHLLQEGAGVDLLSPVGLLHQRAAILRIGQAVQGLQDRRAQRFVRRSRLDDAFRLAAAQVDLDPLGRVLQGHPKGLRVGPVHQPSAAFDLGDTGPDPLRQVAVGPVQEGEIVTGPVHQVAGCLAQGTSASRVDLQPALLPQPGVEVEGLSRPRPAAVVGHDHHQPVRSRLRDQPSHQPVQLAIGFGDDVPVLDTVRRVVERVLRVCVLPELVLVTVGDAADADVEVLLASLQEAGHGLPHGLDLEVGVAPLFGHPGGQDLVVGVNGEGSQLRPQLRRESVGPRAVRRGIAGHHHAAHRPDGIGHGHPIGQHAALLLAQGIEKGLAGKGRRRGKAVDVTRIVAQVQVAEVEDAGVGGVLTGQEGGPGGGGVGRKDGAQPPPHALGHQLRQVRKLASGQQRVDDVKGRAVQTDDQRFAVSFLRHSH